MMAVKTKIFITMMHVRYTTDTYNNTNTNTNTKGVYMQQKYNIRTIESFYELKIDVQEQFFKLGNYTPLLHITIY